MQKTVARALIALVALGVAGTARAASNNGRAGTMPAYYDDRLFTINLKEQAENAGRGVPLLGARLEEEVTHRRESR